MDLLLQKKIQPPFKPKVDASDWLNNFDKDFTSMKPRINDPGEDKPYEADKDPFKDF